MDLSAQELAELEERLYSSIHHANADQGSEDKCNADTASPSLPPPGPVRVVTDKAIINDARQVTSAKMKRYWSSIQHSKVGFPASKPRKGSTEVQQNNENSEEVIAMKKKATFTPYQSVLGPVGGESSPTRVTDSGFVLLERMPHVAGEKNKKRKVGDGKKVLNPSSLKGKKLEQLKKIKTKRAKAQKTRQKLQTGQQRLVATIELETSSDEESQPQSGATIKKESREGEIDQQDLEDSDADEVVVIPNAPPPLVCIESSDDEVAKDGFTHPESKRKKKAKKNNSPRCLSPSNSSIMSDDFIGHSDRTRLNDSFIEGIANDEELDCHVPRSVGALLAGESLVTIPRETRAPSISSDGTVATSSDTTDQDKRNSLNKAQLSGPAAAPRSCSTPKQTLPVRKTSTGASLKNQKTPTEEDSIYKVTSAKKSKPSVADKAISSESSNDSDGGNVSSHSKRSKSYHSDASSSKSFKKTRRKWRRVDSERYSDEDFASMLTDIVQAISENESDEEDCGEDGSVEVEKPAADDDILEIKDQEPNLISLPQVEPRVEVPALEESNDSAVVPVEAPPPPMINLVDGEANQEEPPHNSSALDEPIAGLRRIDENPEYCWNDEIKKFYNNSWGGEDFNVSTVLFNMPRSKDHWPIVHKDLYPDPPKKEIICNNCGERGHMRNRCRKPAKPRTCYMCGLTGHQEPRCPNTLCLKCGAKTRSFLRGCQSCAREQNMTCHLCGFRGHMSYNCPDKWRRYHSTIEDNKPLTRDYVRNPNARHCCICARPGHQAHMCHAALRIFGQCVPTTDVKNYQPIYERNWAATDQQQQQQQGKNRGPRFNMFSEMGDYELSFDDSLTMNESSFYHRFYKSVGLLEKRKRKEKLLRKKRGTKKRKTDDANESKGDDVAGPKGEDRNKPMNEDSNYSFSEYYEEKKSAEPPLSAAAPDFIPLMSDAASAVAQAITPAAPATTVEVPTTEAKIFLTKPHAKILLGPNGANFLKDASAKFCLKLSIAFQSVGNVLLANGCSQNQDNFHNELVKYLNDASHQNEQIKQINNVPKGTDKTIRYIIEHLQLLTRSYENVKNMFQRYQHFEQQGANVKTCDKIRRNLNIILFGQFGMRQGRDHLNQLQVNLKSLKNTKNPNVSMSTRDEINQHIRYIFTSYDHSCYADIISEYDDLRKRQKLNKIKPEDLDLPKNTDRENYSDDSFTFSKELGFEEQLNKSSDGKNDLILNTSDQLISLESPKEEAKPTEPSPLSQLPLTPKFKKSKKIDFLLTECRQMVDVLNSVSITAKFDRIYEQAQDGQMSAANHRTLRRIHVILKSKLHRKLQAKKKLAGN